MSQQQTRFVTRQLSCELRSYTAWVGAIGSTVAYVFGFASERPFWALLLGSVVLGLSSLRSRPDTGG